MQARAEQWFATHGALQTESDAAAPAVIEEAPGNEIEAVTR